MPSLKAGKWLLLCFPLLAFTCWWTWKSLPENRFVLRDGSECKVQFHRWTSGRCVISHHVNGVRSGTIELGEGLFTHPFAVFPDSQSNTLICFSTLDTTLAAFAVDLKNPNAAGIVIPRRLEDAVECSNFSVRACTTQEVTSLTTFIQNSTPAALSGYVYGGIRSEQRKQNLLMFLKLATSERDLEDPVLKNARPQLLPGQKAEG